MRGILVHMLPRKDVSRGPALAYLNGYGHHLGPAVIVFGYLPHTHFVKRHTGLSSPALPEPGVFVVAGLTFVSVFIALLARLTDTIRRRLSGFDDYFRWLVVFLPLVIGMIATHQPYAPVAEPLPPFGELGHAFLGFYSRGVTGAALARTGAAV